jgi:hypothetical protein
MGQIRVDISRFSAAHQGRPGSGIPALWTFSIRDKDVCFWGAYPQAEAAARRYAHHRGMTEGTIFLLDYSGEPTRTRAC